VSSRCIEGNQRQQGNNAELRERRGGCRVNDGDRACAGRSGERASMQLVQTINTNFSERRSSVCVVNLISKNR
jgi:hypothetical protein